MSGRSFNLAGGRQEVPELRSYAMNSYIATPAANVERPLTYKYSLPHVYEERSHFDRLACKPVRFHGCASGKHLHPGFWNGYGFGQYYSLSILAASRLGGSRFCG